jgi:hypothetical protein
VGRCDRGLAELLHLFDGPVIGGGSHYQGETAKPLSRNVNR